MHKRWRWHSATPISEAFVQARGMNHVRFFGASVHELVRERLGRAWTLIMPSECYENQPLAVFESLQSGTPVIGSRLGGLAEIIERSQAGWTFSPGDSNGLRSTVSQVIRDAKSRAAASAAARRYFQENHSPDVIFRRLMPAYQRALAMHETREAVGMFSF
jgi:glycosyltransferase involved in cell wall biosynthesis